MAHEKLQVSLKEPDGADVQPALRTGGHCRMKCGNAEWLLTYKGIRRGCISSYLFHLHAERTEVKIGLDSGEAKLVEEISVT